MSDKFKLVPAEPDRLMCQAGQEKAREWPRFPLRITSIYKAMVDAAPATPAATWRGDGEPDPHDKHYDCERAGLILGQFTDDELANGAFMNYDRPMDIERLLRKDPDYYTPIVWMTAVKERIRWLSRALVKATAAPVALDAWVSTPESLPTKPGNYLAMMADENSFGYTSDEPVLVEFDAYIDHPGQFTISDSWNNGPARVTEEVELWMTLPARPVKASTPGEAS